MIFKLHWFDVFLTNLEKSHPGGKELLQKGAISVARSLIPGNLCAVDKTMEEVFMRFAKSRGGAGGAGLTGILQNFGTLQRWIRTASERTKFYQATLDMLGMIQSEDNPKYVKHRELGKSEIIKGEKAVQRTLSAIDGWLDPFNMTDKDKLFIISSGAPVSSEIKKDVLGANEAGKKAKEELTTKRLQTSKVDFYDKIRKLKLLTMEKTNKTTKLTTTQGKVIKYQEQGDLAFQVNICSLLSSMGYGMS